MCKQTLVDFPISMTIRVGMLNDPEAFVSLNPTKNSMPTKSVTKNSAKIRGFTPGTIEIKEIANPECSKCIKNHANRRSQSAEVLPNIFAVLPQYRRNGRF